MRKLISLLTLSGIVLTTHAADIVSVDILPSLKEGDSYGS